MFLLDFIIKMKLFLSPLFFVDGGGVAEASGSAVFLRAAGGNQKTGRKYGLTHTHG